MSERPLELALETPAVEDVEEWVNVGARLEFADPPTCDGKLAFETLIFGQQ
jgi:hypothetical protein